MATSSRNSTSSSTNKVTLTFFMEQLVHEVSDLAFLSGEVTEEGPSRRMQQEAGADENRRVLERFILSAFTRAKAKLLPLSKDSLTEDTAIDDAPKETKKLYLILNLTDEYDHAIIERIEAIVHDYLVYYALYLWTAVASPDSSLHWKELCEDFGDELSDLRLRGGFVQRKLYPF